MANVQFVKAAGFATGPMHAQMAAKLLSTDAHASRFPLSGPASQVPSQAHRNRIEIGYLAREGAVVESLGRFLAFMCASSQTALACIRHATTGPGIEAREPGMPIQPRSGQ